MKHRSNSPIILLVSRMIAPYIMLFGLYVVFHGHYGPGGGFQGGAIIAAAFYLIRIANEPAVYEKQFRSRFAPILGATGILVFFGVGLAAVFFGGNYLDYGFVPIPALSAPQIRSTGILLVEVAVALAVAAIFIQLYDVLIEEGDDDV